MDQSRYEQLTETEEKIFAAALVVFAEHGREGARMQDIADAAGINKALVHYYFRSKDRLYEEVFAYIMRKFFSMLTEALKPADRFEDVLRIFISNYIDMLREHGNLVRFVLHEVSMGAPVFRQRMQASMQTDPLNPPTLLVAAIERARANGEIRDVDPIQTLITIVSACVFFFLSFPIMSAIFPEMEARRDELIEERKQHVFDLIYNGLATRRTA
jgi:TetR/AcrR family transcriptional regulator